MRQNNVQAKKAPCVC